jgi:23S rRNA pseudoU1915 N3-methylase RlmH
MRVVIAAVGRLKDGPERLLFERYRARFEATGRRLGFAPVLVRETPESGAGTPGLGADLLARAGHKISFGPITLPHQLARIVLAEQLYRAATILAGHPYHRA